jgi:hypothetical protein
MWLKKTRPNAKVHLVEPGKKNIKSGKHNFKLNGFTGEFTRAFVGKDQFGVDDYFVERGIQKVDILHSDIQGYEVEMLEDCSKSLANKIIDYVFISTHSQQLHREVEKRLEDFDYRVEVSSDFDYGTTSYDGIVFASNRSVEPVFKDFTPMSRIQIEEAQPALMVDYLSNIMRAT